MTTSLWYEPLPAYLWQVFLHSFVMGAVLFAWTRWVHLPSGQARRQLLAATLALPLITAALPGRIGFDFREQLAWFDSARVLKLPIAGGFLIHHLVLIGAAIVLVVTVRQEIVPLFTRPEIERIPVPERWARRARAMPGWSRVELLVASTDEIHVATSGRPSRPRLVISQGALALLNDEELDVVIRHEHAHWTRGRWWTSHLLYAARIVQVLNPVALWCFREFTVELELDCDEDAVQERDGRLLAGVLFRIYESTDRRDLASRGMLRRRIEALLGDLPRSRDSIDRGTLLAALASFVVVLPWLV